MAALDYITIQGFKSISRIEKLELRPINIVIGANGSGKSNFIGVFSFLHAIRQGNLRDYVAKAGGADRILFFGSEETEYLAMHLSFDKEVNQYWLELYPTQDDRLIPANEKAAFWDKQKYPEQSYIKPLPSSGTEAAISSKTAAGVLQHVQGHLDSWRIYHFHDTSANAPLRKTADLHDNEYLRSDGANLAAFLYFLKTRHNAEYSLICRTIERVAPFFRDFVLKPLALNEEKIRIQWIHHGRDAYFDVSSLSDGTLRFMALATLLLQPTSLRPSIILMDEPELGLHPYAITLLASLIRQASVETQVILSTQSALLLDYFDPEDVLVTKRGEDGGTQFQRLSNEKLKSWLEDYSLGQLWEKNEIGGRPGDR